MLAYDRVFVAIITMMPFVVSLPQYGRFNEQLWAKGAHELQHDRRVPYFFYVIVLIFVRFWRYK
ncbi:hypothetical protein V1507DRAFT_447050 [Lipomyces tetrasporus]